MTRLCPWQAYGTEDAVVKRKRVDSDMLIRMSKQQHVHGLIDWAVVQLLW